MWHVRKYLELWKLRTQKIVKKSIPWPGCCPEAFWCNENVSKNKFGSFQIKIFMLGKLEIPILGKVKYV